MACGGSEDGGGEPVDDSRYAAGELWLCGPDAEKDYCLEADMSVTELMLDGSERVVEHVVADNPGLDCFYVYPTVELVFTPDNVTEERLGEQEHIDNMLDAVLGHAGPLTSVCRVIAPKYRQATIGAYSSAAPDDYLEFGYADVEEAFRRYLRAHGGSRPFVIMGHSQGTHMTRRLIQRVIEPDAKLRERFVAGLLIGGDVMVPKGESIGGAFSEFPLCSAPDELGCIIAYRSYADALPPIDGAQLESMWTVPEVSQPDVACSNPASLGGGSGRLSGSLMPLNVSQPLFSAVLEVPFEVSTPWVVLRDYYDAECKTDADGLSFLAVRAADEATAVRPDPIPYDSFLFDPSGLGLHLLDYNFASYDLVEQVRLKRDSL